MVGTQLILVFVYGTLKKGQPNYHRITSGPGKAVFLGEGTTATKIPLVVASEYNIPFLLAKHGTGKNINGEVYEIDSDKLKDLDELEVYPSLYDREIQKIHMKNGEEVDAWLYLLRKYDPAMLQLEMLDNYADGEHGSYVPRSGRREQLTDPKDIMT